MFVNVFGEVYDKNPNLTSIDITKEEAVFLKEHLLELMENREFTEEEELYIVAPLINRLDKEPLKLLIAEVKFLLKITYDDILKAKLSRSLLSKS